MSGKTVFEVGAGGSVRVGRGSKLESVRIICDSRIEIGEQVLISAGVLLSDNHRAWGAPGQRPAPIRIGDGAWIGFASQIRPGVTIGEGAIVGARSVVNEDVPPFTVVAGNPARVVRSAEPRSGVARVSSSSRC